jgi:hypothetical protein
MGDCYLLKIDKNAKEGNFLSFIGGKPSLPRDICIPDCQLCGSQLTFFFQIAIPTNHQWEGLSMAIFACTTCVNEEYLIPEMPDGILSNIKLPKGYLHTYQRNFKILVFKTKEAVTKKYTEKIKYKPISLQATKNLNISLDKLGGNPNWLLDDESPSMYDEVPMFFLLQMLENYQFEILPNALPQMTLGLNGDPIPSEERYYELFLGNKLFFFGTEDRSNPLVYITTQI